MSYRNVQTAPLMYLIAVGGGVVGAVALASDSLGRARWWLVALGLLLIAVGLVAARLTVVVDSTSVSSAFGWGWPRRDIRLGEIEGAAVVNNSWWYGWGLRKVRGGWMFNNAGRDAVELTLRSGKVFRIGTDQPDELLAVLKRAQTA
jgi:hypothetical protein